MATQLQLRKGTKVQNDAFTGAEGELTYVSDTKSLRIHDGSTQGGISIGGLAMPDYANAVALTGLDSYQQITADGYIFVQGSGAGNWNAIGIHISTDGSTSAFQITQANMYETRFIVPVSKGVYVKRYDSYVTVMKFIPCK